MIDKLLSKEVQSFIIDHESDDPFQLSLKYNDVCGVPIRLISEQVAGRQKAKSKLPTWYETEGIIFPPKLSMEQCSSEVTARYKASLVNGKQFIDLTGGTGVDTWAICESFKKGVYVEQREELVQLARSNFSALGLNRMRVHHGSAEDYLNAISESLDCIYIDPARRDENKNRVFLLEDSSPNIISLLPKLKAKANQILIKTSPMMDIQLALKSMSGVMEIHIVSVDNDCKEVLYLVSGDAADDVQIKTINFKKGIKEMFQFTLQESKSAVPSYSLPKQYLYEPNAAVMKAGAFELLCEAFSMEKLHANTHLYTSNMLRNDFPGRVFRIQQILPYSKREIRNTIPKGKANIATRNFKDDVATIRKKTGLKDGGEWFLFGFTDVKGAQNLALCTKV